MSRKYIVAGVLVSSPLIVLAFLMARPYLDQREYDAHIRKGQRYLSDDQSFQAVAEFTEAAKLVPAGPVAYLERSRAHLGRGEKAEAIRDLRTAIEIQPNNPGPYVALGDLYLQSQDQYPAAIEQYQKAFQLGLSRAQLDYKCALAFFYVSRLDDSIDAAKKALQKKADLGEASGLLGIIYLARDDAEQAIPYLQKAVVQLPAKQRPYDELGTAYMAVGKYADAIEAFKQAAESRGKTAGLYLRTARCFAAQGDRESALAQIGLALQADPKLGAAYVELARVWLRALEAQSDPNAADKTQAALDRARPLFSPGSSEVEFLQGRVAEIRKDYRLALESYTRATRLAPTIPEAYEQLAAVNLALGNRPGAEEALKRAAVLKAKSPAVFYIYGRFLIQSQRYLEAIEKLSAAVSLDPKKVNYYLTLAEAQRLAGRIQDAKATLARASALDPQNADVLAARRRLGA